MPKEQVEEQYDFLTPVLLEDFLKDKRYSELSSEKKHCIGDYVLPIWYLKHECGLTMTHIIELSSDKLKKLCEHREKISELIKIGISFDVLLKLDENTLYLLCKDVLSVTRLIAMLKNQGKSPDDVLIKNPSLFLECVRQMNPKRKPQRDFFKEPFNKSAASTSPSNINGLKLS